MPPRLGDPRFFEASRCQLAVGALAHAVAEETVIVQARIAGRDRIFRRPGVRAEVKCDSRLSVGVDMDRRTTGCACAREERNDHDAMTKGRKPHRSP
jgi:hypothetical protein